MSDVDPVPGAVHANPVVLQCSFTVRSWLRFGIRRELCPLAGFISYAYRTWNRVVAFAAHLSYFVGLNGRILMMYPGSNDNSCENWECAHVY